MSVGHYRVTRTGSIDRDVAEASRVYMDYARDHGISGRLCVDIDRLSGSVSFGMVDVRKFVDIAKRNASRSANIDLHDHALYDDVDVVLGSSENPMRSRISMDDVDFRINAFVEQQKRLLVGGNYLLSLSVEEDAANVIAQITKPSDTGCGSSADHEMEKGLSFVRRLPDIDLTKSSDFDDYSFD